MTPLIELALKYQQGKMPAMDFSWKFIALRSKLHKEQRASNEQIGIAEWVLFPACDRFELQPIREYAEIDEQEFNVLVNQAIKIGLSSDKEYNNPLFKKEVEQALKSINFI